jgi:hypothetical protein
MLMRRFKLLSGAATLAVTGLLVAAPVASAQPVITGGLVNVVITDVIDDVTVVVQDINVTVPVAAQVIANVCGVQVPVAVLSTQVIANDRTFTDTCDALGGDATFTVTNA